MPEPTGFCPMDLLPQHLEQLTQGAGIPPR
jgi:hypothetical protein